MKTLLALVTTFSLLMGCAHPQFRSPASRQKHQDKVINEVTEIPFYSNSKEFVDLLVECQKLKAGSDKRTRCLDDKFRIGMARVNLIYPELNHETVMDEYLANGVEKVRDLKTDPDKYIIGHWGLTKETLTTLEEKGFGELTNTTLSLVVYELLARVSHVVNRTDRLYANDVRRTDAINNATLQQYENSAAAWGSLANSVQQMQTQSQINNLQRQQNTLQWQQQTGGNGIRPYGSY